LSLVLFMNLTRWRKCSLVRLILMGHWLLVILLRVKRLSWLTMVASAALYEEILSKCCWNWLGKNETSLIILLLKQQVCKLLYSWGTYSVELRCWRLDFICKLKLKCANCQVALSLWQYEVHVVYCLGVRGYGLWLRVYG